MTIAGEKSVVRVALVGNPNTGKSTLFNALSGLRQRVANYPGVTVDAHIGHMRHAGRRFELIDLPGTYSLAPQSPDEMVAVDELLGRGVQDSPPDAIVVIVDASNLERNLFLVSQLLEMGRPLVVALNMMDVAANQGLSIDVERLADRLGIPVVPMRAHRRKGIEQLRKALNEVVSDGADRAEKRNGWKVFPETFDREVEQLETALAAQELPRYLVERLLLDTDGYLEDSLLAESKDGLPEKLTAARDRLQQAGYALVSVEANARYDWAARTLDGIVTREKLLKRTQSDRIDGVLTHWFWGTVIFVNLLLVVFTAVFSWALPAMDGIETAGGALSGWVNASMADGALKSLLINGVIAGVGGVLVFLPQIFILFFFIAVLEDCGYLARAAYLMDKLMLKVGLTGKSVIPLISSFACAIPGVMAARVIEDRRDRLVTILIAPLMSCSARLPVYTLLIAAFIPQVSFWGGVLSLQALILFSMYTVGILVAVIVALLLRRTVLRGETTPFVMELPTYKIPSLRVVLARMWEQGGAFVRRAGTLIFAVAIVVWAASYWPRNPESIDPELIAGLAAVETAIESIGEDPAQADELAFLNGQKKEFENQIAGAYQRQSYLGQAGRAIEPVVKPLGWDWRIGCAAIASFPAREVVVGTLGVIYNLGYEQDEESLALRQRLQAATWDDTGEPVFNIPVALSLMVFFALCAQCAATLVVIKRETQSWLWPLFTFTYMTSLAYVAALVTYQVGMLFV